MDETTPTRDARSWSEQLASSRLMRLLAIALLVLLLRIPVAMVDGLIEERAQRRSEVVADVSSKWGLRQELRGPLLVVPYDEVVETVESKKNGATRVRTVRRSAHFLPEELAVDGEVRSEVRRRGIFDVPVYASAFELRGRFETPDWSGLEIDPKRIHWNLAKVVLEIADPRVIQNAPVLRWGDASGGTPFEAGPGQAIHAPVALDPEGAAIAFGLALELRGSGGLYLTPTAGHTRVSLAGDWPHPSFQGGWLPATREVRDDGFEASWSISSLGRSYGQRWLSHEAPSDTIAASRFGVELVTPVDPYRLAERSVKYDALFLVLTFAALWLFEVLAGVRIHAIQYLMVGAAMTLFYLLQLSLAEHLGFALAYGIASAGVIALVAGYALAILGSLPRGAAIGGLVAALYGYLYVLLHNQDHALLVGSVGLFVALAAIMWLTRRVDWYAPTEWRSA